jgi:hypothetical protein
MNERRVTTKTVPKAIARLKKTPTERGIAELAIERQRVLAL